MYIRNKFQKVISVTAAALTLSAAMTIQAKAETLKIGMITSLSGPAAPFGVPERDIVKIMVDRLNAEGGINGRQIELIVEDDQTNPTEAVRDATRLIRQEKVIAIIGASTGSSTLAFAPIAAQAKVPVYAPVATQSVTSRDHSFFPWMFRTAPASAITMQAMMEGQIFKPEIKKVAIMYQEDAYGKEEFRMARELIEKQGGIDIVAEVSAPLTATDLSSAATRIRNADPDIVLLLTSAPSMGGAFARGAEQAQLEAPILGSLSINQNAFVKAAGKAGNGIMSVSLGNWFEPSAKQAKLGEILKEAGKAPEGYAETIGSNAILILTEAIKNVSGEVNGQSIRDATEKLCDFDGTYSDGKVCYTPEQHDGYGPDTVNVVRLQDGIWKNVK